MKFVCTEHGRIRGVGRNIRHCPICAKRAIPVFFIPKIYIDKVVILILLGVGVVGTACYLVIPPTIHHVQASHAYTASVLNGMNPTWRSLYNQLEAVNSTQEVEVCRMYVDSNRDALHKLPALTPDEMALLVNVVNGQNEGEIAKLLAPFAVKQ